MSAVADESREGLLSPEGYFAFLRTCPHEERWQLIDGTAVMMTPPTLVHQRIALNLERRLNDALESARPDLVAMFGLGLSVAGHDSFLPEVDVAIVDGDVGHGSYAGRFYLTAEILSDSNTREYISLKLDRYSQHANDIYSLIIAQHEHRIEIWSRASGWRGTVLRSPDDVIDLPEFGFRCSLRELYRGTPLA